MQKTYMAKPAEVDRRWYVLDARGKPLGRLATEAARLLRGKHKPTYTPHVDTGDHVIIVNAEQAVLTGQKLDQKEEFRHSGHAGGVKRRTYRELMQNDPERAVEKAVKGMLPRNRLGRKMSKKLKVYRGPDHPHQAQAPEPWEF